MRPLPFPARVSVEITNRCNQDCLLCPRRDFARPVGSMHRDRFRRVVRELGQHDAVLWMHFLGEPLLHPELIELIDDAVAAGVTSVGFSTNATLLRASLVDPLLDTGLDRLDISIDAVERETYRKMRGADHYDQVVRNVERFLERRRARGLERPVVSLQYLLVEESSKELERTIERWQPLLAPQDFVKTIDPASFGGAVDGTSPPPDLERTPCPWLFGGLMVLQDGTVTTCGADWDARDPVGHIDSATLEEIWTGTEMERRRRAHREGRFGEVAACASCDDWFLADGHGYRNVLPGSTDRPGPVGVKLLGRAQRPS